MKIVVKELEPEVTSVTLVRVGDYFIYEEEAYLRLPNDPIHEALRNNVPSKAFSLTECGIVTFSPDTQVVTTFAELRLTKQFPYCG